ncbi:MAG TPA: glycosyltransferase family 2 protein [bacterium]|nr:glycosyltransferase family 2 protein [bacterium]
MSVIMPVRNEVRHIQASLDAVLTQDYPAGRMEVLVVDGMSEDETREIVRRTVEHRHPGAPPVALLDNPSRIVPAGLNIGLRRARGEVIIRVDGHCEIARDYIRQCVRSLARTDADCVGGPIETVGETPVAQAIAAAMSSPFGVGNAAFRTTRDRERPVDTVAFGAYRRAVFERIGPFDEEFVRTQDAEFNYRLIRAGGRILLIPVIRSMYYSRATLRSLWRQYLEYGFWKARLVQKRGIPSWRQLVPPALVLTVGAGLALAVLRGQPAWLVPGWAYVGANLLASASTASRRGWRFLPWLPAAFAAIHFAFGMGFWKGLWTFGVVKRLRWERSSSSLVGR